MLTAIYSITVTEVFRTRVYFVVHEPTRHAVIIDPGAQAERIAETVTAHEWTIDAVVLTHGHFDHFSAAAAMRERFQVPILAHSASVAYLGDPDLNLSARHGRPRTLDCVEFLAEGEELPFVQPMTVLHTPGHTDDSVTYYCEEAGAAIVGDTVYEGGPGLTIFPTGDEQKLARSLVGKLLTLPGHTTLLSGHSLPMTVQELQQTIAR
ncbi:MBL fold metallo-hydrolase [Actinobaculum sp. 313]|uniref:MBL fold metallo-hydrolase n=1 Tax=Actinobaculum sp. 313 TaxID=2495645 RepID=UPI000D528F4E|nr:MBL fold metallo-hydrolase [Actinobaculum sp. 313]AWE42105.1 MBL fold metallo-hydrolase [Actinobaculum sp. 313]